MAKPENRADAVIASAREAMLAESRAVADTARWVEMCGVADLIWLESPSNPLLAVADLDLICAAPRKPGAILGVDNTFATPLNQRPLALGADVAVQSVTKFIGGHSDLLGGVVTVRDANLLASLRQARELAGRKGRLFVALNSDRSVRELKGPLRPILDERSRAYNLGQLRSVDGIVIFRRRRLTREILALRPDLYVKAGDYTLETLDPDERAALEKSAAAVRELVDLMEPKLAELKTAAVSA